MRLDEMRHQESLPSWRDEWAAHIDDIVNHWQGELSREPLPYWKRPEADVSVADRYAAYTTEVMENARQVIYALFPEMAPDKTLIAEQLRWADDGGSSV